MSHLRRGEGALLGLGALGAWLGLPATTHAECGWLEPATCVNAAQYAFWNGLAIDLWSANRVLLTLAYQLDILRDWLVATVFRSVFQTVATAISPALAPIATLAVLIGVLVFLLLPIIGRVEIVNIRRALVWIVVAPMLLATAGQGLAGVEQARTTMGQTLFAAAQAVGSTPRFGATADEMPNAAIPLYPFTGCPGGALTRPFTDGSSGGLFMDDLAAALMYANAQDIHCPNAQGPAIDLPDAFFSSPPTYATTRDLSAMTAAESKGWADNMQRGVTRLTLGLIPSLLAVLNAVIQLLFALALVLLFIALPLGLLLVFFTNTASGVTGLLRRGVQVVQTSWSSSLLLGIVFVALGSAARLGNVAAFVGLSVAGIFVTLFIVVLAVHALLGSVGAVGHTVGLATGIGAGAVGLALGGAVGAAVVPALAGKTALDMGTSYAVARRAGTSRRYAVGTALGRVGGVARVGELASALGLGGEVTDGIYTGHRGARSREGYRVIQRSAATDAGKTDAAGLTMREREEERDLQWAAERARRGSNLEQAGRLVGGSARAVVHPIAAVRAASHTAHPGIERVRELGGDSWRGAWERARAARASVAERVDDPVTIGGIAGAVAGAASNRFVRDGRSGRLARGNAGGLEILPRVPDDQLPAWAAREPAATVAAGHLLQRGYHLQYDSSGSVTVWHPAGPAGGDAADGSAVTPPFAGAPAAAVQSPASPGGPPPQRQGAAPRPQRPRPGPAAVHSQLVQARIRPGAPPHAAAAAASASAPPASARLAEPAGLPGGQDRSTRRHGARRRGWPGTRRKP